MELTANDTAASIRRFASFVIYDTTYKNLRNHPPLGASYPLVRVTVIFRTGYEYSLLVAYATFPLIKFYILLSLVGLSITHRGEYFLLELKYSSFRRVKMILLAPRASYLISTSRHRPRSIVCPSIAQFLHYPRFYSGR